MTKKTAKETIAVKFIKDFDGYKAGEILDVSESNLCYFLEWEAVEVVEK